MKINKVAIALATLLASGVAWSHGYVIDPPSRAALCKQGKNNQCDRAAVYNADSIITSADFAGDFPQDGKLASGGLKQFSSLNSERATRWEKNSLDKGQLDISWQFTSPSRVATYKYYLTKPDWQQRLDSAHHLTRDSFASTPFCEHSGSDEKVQGLISHSCQLPESHGYQLIYAVADMAKEIDGSRERIFNVIDVDIDHIKVGRPAIINSEWNKEIATIDRIVNDVPMKAPAGKTILVRFFSDEGELTLREGQVALLPGEENDWSYYVAETINGKYNDVRAGVMHENGVIYPEKDKINSIFVKSDSPLIHAEISFN